MCESDVCEGLAKVEKEDFRVLPNDRDGVGFGGGVGYAKVVVSRRLKGSIPNPTGTSSHDAVTAEPPLVLVFGVWASRCRAALRLSRTPLSAAVDVLRAIREHPVEGDGEEEKGGRGQGAKKKPGRIWLGINRSEYNPFLLSLRNISPK